jgi:hypothetical protein
MRYWLLLGVGAFVFLGGIFAVLVLLGLNAWIALIAVVLLGISVALTALHEVEAPELKMRESVWYDKEDADL